jgi:hypothetical protein
MAGKGKSKGFKGWKKISRVQFELYAGPRRKLKVGHAHVVRSGNRWYAEIETNIIGIYSEGLRSPLLDKFDDAVNWMNSHRKIVSKKLNG